MKRKNSGSGQRPSKTFSIAVNLITVLSFFGLLFLLAGVTAFSEKREFSETENRNLASFPKLSGKKVFSGAFMDGIEEYITDHFAGHDGWITLKTELELLSGKREQNDIYILKNRLVEKVKEPDDEVVGKSISGINRFAEENDIPVFVMIVPTSAEIYSDELPANAPNLDQKTFIENVYSQLDDSIVTLDAYSQMMSNKNQYIYYRTDHHWTTRGAYLVYAAAGKKMGYTPVPESAFDIDHASSEFRGTFYSKVLYDGIETDTIDLWLPSESDDMLQVEIVSGMDEEPDVYDSMYFREYLDVKDKYATFLGPNMPVVNIRTGSSGGKLLVFKDSYAHCYAPFLACSYSEITLVDLRYIQLSYKSLIDVSQYDQVLFLYNASGFSQDENLKKLMFG
ncbi:MAG: DHHW family protein [Huintestinicola sp.]